MKRCIIVLSLFVVMGSPAAADAPLVEQYLHKGEFAKGEQALEAAIAANPRDDQARFGLGFLRFVRGIERMGQAWHEYGVKTEHNDVPFLRLPVPKNLDPAPMSYTLLRRVLDDFIRDMTAAEKALAGITDDNVQLPIHLADIRLDFDGDGKATDRLLDLLKAMMKRTRFEFLDSNPRFLVKFDRGDVAWLRSYCHLLSGMLDCYLAIDGQELFDATAAKLIAKPKVKNPKAELGSTNWSISVTEPLRWSRARKHFLKVAELNRETWKHIRAEIDNDFEWLPHPAQKGVLGLPVTNDMVNGWLDMMTQLEAVFEGKRTFLKAWAPNKEGNGLNLKLLMEFPPEKIDLNGIPGGLADKYYTNDPEMDINMLFRVVNLFTDSMAGAYAMWFN